MYYMPEYCDKQIFGREFFFGVLSALYQRVTSRLVELAYSARKARYTLENNEMIELTAELKSMIYNVVCFKNKILTNVDFHIVSPGKVIQHLKVKSKEKRVSKERFKFPANLNGFSERTIYRVRKPITGDSSGAQRRTSER